jgi:hypothetical protein
MPEKLEPLTEDFSTIREILLGGVTGHRLIRQRRFKSPSKFRGGNTASTSRAQAIICRIKAMFFTVPGCL